MKKTTYSGIKKLAVFSTLMLAVMFMLPAPVSAQKLELPACIDTGNCSLDDIVGTGAAFANLLTEISAALFFATFIYGGAMYLLSFGEKSRVDRGKKAITGAAIGMAIVLMAWTLVNYVYGSLTGGGTPGTTTEQQGAPPKTACETNNPGFSCMTLTGADQVEQLQNADKAGLKCATGFCASPMMCCGRK